MIKLTMHHFMKTLSLSSTRGTSSEKLNLKLRLEALQTNRWWSKLCLFYKIVNNCLLTCPVIFLVLTEYITWDMQLIFQRLNLHILFKESNILSTVTKWNKSNNVYTQCGKLYFIYITSTKFYHKEHIHCT